MLAAAALALVFAGAFPIVPGLALGPEPGGAGAVGGAALLEAGFAERAIGRGPGLAALYAQSRRAALSGALVVALEIAPAPFGDVAASHDGLLAAIPEMDGTTARRRRAGRTSGEEAVSATGGTWSRWERTPGLDAWCRLFRAG